MFGHSKGSGLFSKGLGMAAGDPMGPRQLTMVAAEGFSGNGMATIGMDNTFSLIAHLPPPHTLSPYSPAVYAAYLVDGKGKNGFYAGPLKAAGNGMYQANFRSPVPLVHYNRVVVSLESPQGIGQAPQGPIVMKVKEGLLDGLGPVKKMGGDMWGKVKGFVGNRFGGKTEEIPQQAPVLPQQTPFQQQPPVQQYPGQQGTYSPPGGYGQGGYGQGSYPPQGAYQQGGYYYNAYPRGRGMYPQGISQQRPFTPQQPGPLTQQYSQIPVSPVPPVQPQQAVQPQQMNQQVYTPPVNSNIPAAPSNPSPEASSVSPPQQPPQASSASNSE